MTIDLGRLAIDAQARLDADAQAQLAEIIEAFVVNHTAEPDFTPEEMKHLRRVGEEPFEPADPAEVEALFARARGLARAGGGTP